MEELHVGAAQVFTLKNFADEMHGAANEGASLPICSRLQLEELSCAMLQLEELSCTKLQLEGLRL